MKTLTLRLPDPYHSVLTVLANNNFRSLNDQLLVLINDEMNSQIGNREDGDPVRVKLLDLQTETIRLRNGEAPLASPPKDEG